MCGAGVLEKQTATELVKKLEHEGLFPYEQACVSLATNNVLQGGGMPVIFIHSP